MLMPVLRLLLIYCILALAVVGVIERDVIRRFVLGEPQPVASASLDAPAAVPATVAAGDGDTDAATALSADVAQIAPAPAPAPVPAPTEAASQPGPVTEATAEGSAAAPIATAPSSAAPTPAAPAPATTAPAAPAPGQIAKLQAPVADGGAPAPAAASPAADPVYPPAQDPAAATPPAPAGAGGSIADARAAYWAGDYARATDVLNALVAAKPDDPDVIGELGNLQYARRDFAGAAASYLRAGELLAAQGHADRAQMLVAVLQQIDQAKAAVLVKRLQGR